VGEFIEPDRSYTECSFQALLFIPKVEDVKAMVDFLDGFCTTLSSHCLSLISSEKYETSTLVFTDGSKSENVMVFGVYVPGLRQVGYCLHEPSSVFTVEINALLDALLFITFNQLVEYEYLILSDNLNLIGAVRSQNIRTHPIIFGFKEVLWWLCSGKFKFNLM
jgi:hypothetical protein